MPQQVEVARTLLAMPAIDRPERKVYQVRYRAGELPPHFIYIDEKEWSKEEETKRIKADIQKRIEAKREIISI